MRLVASALDVNKRVEVAPLAVRAAVIVADRANTFMGPGPSGLRRSGEKNHSAGRRLLWAASWRRLALEKLSAAVM